MSRRVRCYLARTTLVLFAAGALFGMNFVNVELDSPFLWADKHTTLLSMLMATVVGVLGFLAVVVALFVIVNGLWEQAFHPDCKRR